MNTQALEQMINEVINGGRVSSDYKCHQQLDTRGSRVREKSPPSVVSFSKEGCRENFSLSSISL